MKTSPINNICFFNFRLLIKYNVVAVGINTNVDFVDRLRCQRTLISCSCQAADTPKQQYLRNDSIKIPNDLYDNQIRLTVKLLQLEYRLL